MRQLKLTFLLTALLSAVGANIYAHDIEVANADGVTIYYNWTNNQTELAVSYRGSSYDSYSNEYSGAVNIPESVTYNGKTYPVTSIGEWAFPNCRGLTSVTIPGSVTSIGDYAFCDCSGLTSVTIPNSVTSIGNYAFDGCSGLTSVTIPNSVTSIGESAFGCSGLQEVNFNADNCTSMGSSYYPVFRGCTALTTLRIGDNVQEILSYAFYQCSGLTSVTIGNGVTSIGELAFYLCSGLTSVTIPGSVTSIGGYAFSGCSGLTSVTIPGSVTSIGNSAFSGCSGLTSVTIPNSVTSIGDYAFRGCCGLTSVTIPNSVTSIGKDAFYNCSGLTSVTIGNGVTSIGKDAFYNCSGLTSVTIGNGVTSIGERAFYGCSGLQEVNFNADNCTSMGSSSDPVFSGCTALTTLRIGNNVKNIPSYAFQGRSGLTSVTIPGSVTNIGDAAFEGCSGLTSVTIGNGVTSIGYRAFYNTYLKSVTIGSGVLSIGSDAFDYSISSYISSYAAKPVKVIWLTNTPPSGYKNAEGMVNYVANDLYSLSNKTVYPFLSSVFEVDGVKYVPVSPSERTCDAIDCLYDESAAQIRIGETVNFKGINMAVKQVHPYALYLNKHIKNVELNFQGNVGDYAFFGCTGVQKVTANNVGNVGSYAFSKITNPFAATINNLGYIGTNAFSGSTGLKTLEIGNAVTNVSSQSFYGCSGLTTARINNRGTLGEKAFQSCSALESATIGDGVTSIGQYCFDGCTKLQNIVIPNAVTTIGAYAFQNCKSMVSAKMGSGVKTINTYTFSGCSALTEMQIGSNVNVIGTYTFNGCSSLQKIEIPKAVTDVNNYTFYGCGKLKEVVIADRVNILKLGSNGSSPLFSSCPLDSVYIGGNISYSTSSSYGYSPFYRNTSLRSVMITDKETEISTNEFYGCTNLKNVSIGDGVTTIGDWAFSGCSSLDYFAFGSSVRSIGKEAFSDCTAVTRVISRAGTPPTCGSQALDDINKWTCTLTVPKGHLANYQAADQWKEFFFVEETDAGSIYYTLTYVVDGQEYKKVVVAYGDPITPEPAPTKDGYVFSGWSEIPETMPARNVTVTGTFTESTSSNQLVIGNLASDKGKQVVFPISMNNTAKITGLQLDLYLPDGVTVATNSKGKMLISTTDRMDGTYSISSSQMDGFVRILGYSADGDAFSGNSGDILNVTLNIADNVADGNYTIRIKDIVLSDVNSTEYHPADAGATLTVKSYVLGDVDNSEAININDVVCIINHILNRQVGTFIAEAADVDGSGTININDVVTLINRYILHKSSAPVLLAPALAGITDDNYLHLATISLKPGETKEIEMILTNGNAVAAVQGNVKLPEGVSFVTKSNGRLDVKNIDSRSEDFTLSCALQEDGSMTFAHYSADGFTYDGSDGGIFTFKVKADENAVAGNYDVNLSDVVLSINGVGYELTNRTSVLTVGNGTTGIRSIDNSQLTTDSWYTIDGKKLAGEPKEKGIYIRNGRKVVK